MTPRNNKRFVRSVQHLSGVASRSPYYCAAVFMGRHPQCPQTVLLTAAWAKHVTDSVLREDTDPDQDGPRAGSTGRDMKRDRDLPINYSSVVDMLRKSPLPAAVAAAAAASTPNTSNATGDAAPEGSRAAAGAAADSASSSPASESLNLGEPSQRQSAEAGSRPTAAHQIGRGPRAANDGPIVAHVAAAGDPPPVGASAAAPPSGRGGHAGSQTAAAGGGRDAAAAATSAGGGGGGGPLHRGEVSVTPAALRPRCV
jgi:hypothetical protein